MNEVKDFHPLVAAWLTENGYAFIHEYDMPDYGCVDFFATHTPTGEQLIVECKPEKKIKSGIVQLAGYRVQMPSVAACLAVNKVNITPDIEAMAVKYSIGIIGIDVNLVQSENVINETIELFHHELQFADTIIASPSSTDVRNTAIVAQFKAIFERFIHMLFEVSPIESYKQVKQEIELSGIKTSRNIAVESLDKAVRIWMNMDIDAIMDTE